MSEPRLEIGGKRIYGDDITTYHKIHMTSSYHCDKCGASFHYTGEKDTICWNCGKSPYVDLELDPILANKIENDIKIAEIYKERTKDANFGQY